MLLEYLNEHQHESKAGHVMGMVQLVGQETATIAKGPANTLILIGYFWRHQTRDGIVMMPSLFTTGFSPTLNQLKASTFTKECLAFGP
jgi:hypothetical protein